MIYLKEEKWSPKAWESSLTTKKQYYEFLLIRGHQKMLETFASTFIYYRTLEIDCNNKINYKILFATHSIEEKLSTHLPDCCVENDKRYSTMKIGPRNYYILITHRKL